MGNLCIEVVCASLDDIRTANAANVGRIELVTGIELGGLTPSVGLFQEAKRWTEIPLVVMVRPRPGGFCYSWRDLAAMRVDIDMFRRLGAKGVVFGALTEKGEVNQDACKYLLESAGDMETVFHRAFDVTPDPLKALDQLIELGFTRVLTSGQAKSAEEGAGLISRLIREADGRIEVMPGGGIRGSHAAHLASVTQCTSLHLGPMLDVRDETSTRGDVDYGPHPSLDANEIVLVLSATRNVRA